MQHIIGMPLQLIIIGIEQSFIIFIIRVQQLFIMSMLMPGIGIILQVMQSASSVHTIMHFIIGIGMPIGIGMLMVDIMFIIAMPSSAIHIIDRLPHCIIIGMPQFIIIAIISALFLNMAMSMPAAGFMVHIMASAIISHFMVAIIIGIPIIGIMGMVVFIGICMAFIMSRISVIDYEVGTLGADSRVRGVLGKTLAEQPKRMLNECLPEAGSVFICHDAHLSVIWR